MKKVELTNIDDFRFNGKQNYLPGLKSASIKFLLLTHRDKYIRALGLPLETIAVIKDYRNLRNQIHLPGDAIETPGLQKLQGKSILEFLLGFINEQIVSWSNRIIANHKFTFPLLTEFTK